VAWKPAQQESVRPKVVQRAHVTGKERRSLGISKTKVGQRRGGVR
jgi:hypothetical protein